MERYSYVDLKRRLDEITDVVKGWYVSLSDLYETKTGFNDAERLAQVFVSYLPNCVEENENLFYLSFFKTAMYYIESSCNKSDKVLASIKKIARTVEYDGNRESTFSIMIDRDYEVRRNKTEQLFWDACIEELRQLKRRYPQSFDLEMFVNNVSVAIEGFCRDNGYCMTNEEISKSDIYFHLKLAFMNICEEYDRSIEVKKDEA